MTLNLPLLYFVWTEEYCQTSPNKNKSPNLWHVTSILVCCIFGQRQRNFDRFSGLYGNDYWHSAPESLLGWRFARRVALCSCIYRGFVDLFSSFLCISQKKSWKTVLLSLLIQQRIPKIQLHTSQKMQSFFIAKTILPCIIDLRFPWIN